MALQRVIADSDGEEDSGDEIVPSEYDYLDATAIPPKTQLKPVEISDSQTVDLTVNYGDEAANSGTDVIMENVSSERSSNDVQQYISIASSSGQDGITLQDEIRKDHTELLSPAQSVQQPVASDNPTSPSNPTTFSKDPTTAMSTSSRKRIKSSPLAQTLPDHNDNWDYDGDSDDDSYSSRKAKKSKTSKPSRRSVTEPAYYDGMDEETAFEDYQSKLAEAKKQAASRRARKREEPLLMLTMKKVRGLKNIEAVAQAPTEPDLSVTNDAPTLYESLDSTGHTLESMAVAAGRMEKTRKQVAQEQYEDRLNGYLTTLTSSVRTASEPRTQPDSTYEGVPSSTLSVEGMRDSASVENAIERPPHYVSTVEVQIPPRPVSSTIESDEELARSLAAQEAFSLRSRSRRSGEVSLNISTQEASTKPSRSKTDSATRTKKKAPKRSKTAPADVIDLETDNEAPASETVKKKGKSKKAFETDIETTGETPMIASMHSDDVTAASEKTVADAGKPFKDAKSKRGRKKTKESEVKDQLELSVDFDNMEDVQESAGSMNENDKRAQKKAKVPDPEENDTPIVNSGAQVLGEVDGQDNSVEGGPDLSTKKPGQEVVEDKENESAQSASPEATKAPARAPSVAPVSGGVHGYVGPTINTPMPASLLRKAPRTGLSRYQNVPPLLKSLKRPQPPQPPPPSA